MTWQAEAIISIHVPLAGNVRLTALPSRMGLADFYPRSPCGERHGMWQEVFAYTGISIHVPLAGNVGRGLDIHTQDGISIHVPLAGNVKVICEDGILIAEFLSTFPLRGTSSTAMCSQSALTFLSTFPLRGTS